MQALDRLRQALRAPERFGPEPEVWIRFPRQLGDVVFTLPFLGQLQECWNGLAAEHGMKLRWVAVGHRMGAQIFAEAKPDFFAESVLEQGGKGKPDPFHLLRRWRQRPRISIRKPQSRRRWSTTSQNSSTGRCARSTTRTRR